MLLDLMLYVITRIYWELKIFIRLDSETLFILLQSQYYFKVSNLESYSIWKGNIVRCKRRTLKLTEEYVVETSKFMLYSNSIEYSM
jgi:hypothetical protein